MDAETREALARVEEWQRQEQRRRLEALEDTSRIEEVVHAVEQEAKEKYRAITDPMVAAHHSKRSA